MTDQITRLELPGWFPGGDGAKGTNVYLLHGEAPALVGAGPQLHRRALTDALREVGLSASNIHRVLTTSWFPTSLGGAASMVRADLFVPSVDFVAPRAWNEWADRRRAAWLELVDELVDATESWSRDDFDDYLAARFPTLTNHLDFIPMRPGQVVHAAGRALEVIAAPGPHAEHVMLWDARDRVLFCGEFVTMGLPVVVDDLEAYLISLERAIELDPILLLPQTGSPSTRGTWSLRRMMRITENTLASFPTALKKQPKTLRELVHDDFGHLPDEPVEMLEMLWSRRAFLEELVQSGMLSASHAGLHRLYFNE